MKKNKMQNRNRPIISDHPCKIYVTSESRKGKTNDLLGFISHQYDIVKTFLRGFHHTIIFCSFKKFLKIPNKCEFQ